MPSVTPAPMARDSALGGAAALVLQVLGPDPARGAEVARAARLSPSAVSVALRTLAEHGLAERGPGGWRRGPARLDDVAKATGAAEIQRERETRYKQDRESWRARLRQYASGRNAAVAPGDGWLSMDDEDEWAAMLFSRWPVLGDDFVRGPPKVPIGPGTSVSDAAPRQAKAVLSASEAEFQAGHQAGPRSGPSLIGSAAYPQIAGPGQVAS